MELKINSLYYVALLKISFIFCYLYFICVIFKRKLITNNVTNLNEYDLK